ncbi:MAG: IS1380 family transposase [Chloroflexi bacterium]|nr:IS1380 family transposase [Chloroflexota bacterium]
MQQGVLPFQYQQEKASTGMTALAGLPTYLDLMHVARLWASIERHVKVRDQRQGWTDSQMVTTLALLNLSGGDSVDDLRILERDEGFCRVLQKAQTHGLRRGKRRDLERRWRTEKRRSVPSPSAVFRYLGGFHDQEEEKRRIAHTAFIPAPTEALQGLGKVNRELLAFIQSRSPHKTATLDMDATLVETEKRDALYCYKGFQGYQPLSAYWFEQESLAHSEFRDGNVPAGYEQLRVLKEALDLLPQGVEKVRMRSDTAGYQKELLRYCAEGKSERFGVIEFGVGVDVTPAFKQAVREVQEEEWHLLEREGMPTDQEWAEVCFVPDWAGYSKKSPEYRFIATREPLRQAPLPGLEGQMELPFPAMEMAQKGWHKVFGVVTNRDIPGDQVIWWFRQRCGKSEEAHGVVKEDLAGGKLPSGRFGVNAAWWAIAVLAFNLNSTMKRLALGKEWTSKRLKAIRFAFISLPGRVVKRARMLIVRLTDGHPSYDLLLTARQRIRALANGPP